jgi:hypothetical protein
VSSPDGREIEELLVKWNSLRTIENNRRTIFEFQRDESMSRWRELGAHTDADEHYVNFRLARSATTLAEAIELEQRSAVSFTSCRGEMETLWKLSVKDRLKSLSRIRDAAESAIRQDMRYLAALTSSFQSEIDQMVSFMHERQVEGER